MADTEKRQHVTLIGYGNRSRGDDGAGPVLLERFGEQAEDKSLANCYLNLVEDIQLNPEHVLDLSGCDVVIFLDCTAVLKDGYEFKSIQPRAGSQFSSHTQNPENILALFEATLQVNAPPAFLLGLAGHDFELDAPMSAITKTAVESALIFLLDLLPQPIPEWYKYGSSADFDIFARSTRHA